MCVHVCVWASSYLTKSVLSYLQYRWTTWKKSLVSNVMWDQVLYIATNKNAADPLRFRVLFMNLLDLDFFGRNWTSSFESISAKPKRWIHRHQGFERRILTLTRRWRHFSPGNPVQVSLHSGAFRRACEQIAVEHHAFLSEDRRELKDWKRKYQQLTWLL